MDGSSDFSLCQLLILNISLDSIFLVIFVPLSQSLHPIHNQNRNSLHDSNLIPIQVYSERKYEAKITLILACIAVQF